MEEIAPPQNSTLVGHRQQRLSKVLCRRVSMGTPRQCTRMYAGTQTTGQADSLREMGESLKAIQLLAYDYSLDP